MNRPMKKLFALPLVLLAWGINSAHAQTSVALNALGAIPSSSTGTVTQQNAAKQAGFMLELRHISNPFVGYDVSYSFRGANQSYEYTGPTPVDCPGIGCPIYDANPYQSVHADAQELALNWVVSLPLADFRVFALAGGGLEYFDPSGSQSGPTQSQTKGMFDYGGGVDWTILPHLGLRFQYRGDVYKAPMIATNFSSSNKFTHNAEPIIGAYFNF